MKQPEFLTKEQLKQELIAHGTYVVDDNVLFYCVMMWLLVKY